MALDRRIAVNRLDFVRDEHGNSTSSIGATWDVWATRMDRSLEDVADTGGNRDVANRSWRIRWFAEAASLGPTFLQVIENGQSFNVQNIIEVERAGRRRFLEIEAVGI